MSLLPTIYELKMFLKYIKEKFLGMFSNDSMVAFKIIEANINNDFISFILNTPGAPHVTHLLLLKVFRSEI